MEYDFKKIESEWKKYWNKEQIYKVSNPKEGEPAKPKYYVLDMFPYPSGAGLHVGHPLGYIASDIYARYKRLCGYNVLHPMGFDAFGLPAEQYALETGQHPAVTTEKNIARYREQLDNIGFCFDWSREVRTSDASYYKWTQWIFLQLFHSWFDRKENKAKNISTLIDIFAKEGNINTPCPGDEKIQFDAATWASKNEVQQREVLMNYRLAYQGYAQVWWCEALGTVLANDEVVNGVSERGGHPVERKNMRQWFLRITDYADRLLESLNHLEWSEAMKEMQRNWIGKSTGAEVKFLLTPTLSINGEGSEMQASCITVFTTRPDTIFGVDFMVLAPELEIVNTITTPEQKEAVEAYQKYVKSRSERDRMADVKQVTGCFTGAYATHPLNHNPVPIWISEYVLAGYGTGAIMGVPSGDERDHRFAKHFNIPITNIFGDKYTGEDAYAEKTGTITNSGFVTGMSIADAATAIIDTLEKINAGTRKVNYKLRDAGFSRQRYWGEPFPIVYVNDVPYGTDEVLTPTLSINGEGGVMQTHDIASLPVELPHVEHYKPGPEGQGPLANLTEWVNISSPPAPLHEWRGESFGDADASLENDADERFSSIPKYSIKATSAFEKARQNRKNSTDAEDKLWQELRNNKTGYKFRRQHPVDAYIVDFICLQKAIIIEADGDYHNDPEQQKADDERTKTLQDIGFRVLRFTNKQILDDMPFVVAEITKALSIQDTAAHVTPSPFMEKGPGDEVHITRETNTMPGYAGSSWYFLRYMDPGNDTEFASRKATDYWNQVDLYVGGTEHAVGHLLYSRMWTKVLCDLGHIGFDEPFRRLLNQGMIQGMSYFVGAQIWSKEASAGPDDEEIIVSYRSFTANTPAIPVGPYRLKGVDGFVTGYMTKRLRNGHLFVDTKDRLTKSKFEEQLKWEGFKAHVIQNKIENAQWDGKTENGEDYIQCKMEVEKMSKSKYNVVNPDDIVAQYGADTFRMYEMFLGPIDVSKPWDTKGIEGVHRFLKKLWRLYADEQAGWIVTDEAATDAELRILHKTIKKVGEDIERFAFNTAVSQFMITVNELSGCHKRAILEPLAVLICPFAPHIAEELWHKLGHDTSVINAAFPAFEERYITESSKLYPVAINGKMRVEIEFPLDMEQSVIESAVLANETVMKWTEGKAPKKFIFVKGKMINVVI